MCISSINYKPVIFNIKIIKPIDKITMNIYPFSISEYLSGTILVDSCGNIFMHDGWETQRGLSMVCCLEKEDNTLYWSTEIGNYINKDLNFRIATSPERNELIAKMYYDKNDGLKYKGVDKQFILNDRS